MLVRTMVKDLVAFYWDTTAGVELRTQRCKEHTTMRLDVISYVAYQLSTVIQRQDF